MNKQDKVKLIAEKCMGWQKCPTNGGWIDGLYWKDKNSVPYEFDPYIDDADCMAVWDKFSEKRATDLFNGQYVYKKDSAQYTKWFASSGSIEIGNDDRRTAMCDCVVEAIKE